MSAESQAKKFKYSSERWVPSISQHSEVEARQDCDFPFVCVWWCSPPMFPPTQTISCSCRDACLHLMFVCQLAGWSLVTEAVSVEQPGTGCILPALINDAFSVPCLQRPSPHRPGSAEPTSLVEQAVAAGVCSEHFHPNCWRVWAVV